MPSRTTVERWPKSTTARSYVEQERQARLNSGATLSDISDDETNWVLTTVWPTASGDDEPY
jgi:hypothetical protein